MKNELLRLMARCFGVLVWSMGASALVGYIFDIDWFYHWPQSVPMAIPTATAFVVTGATLILLSFMNGRNGHGGHNKRNT